jgi:hypothetical protein
MVNLFRRSIRPPVAVGSAAISLLEELLVLTLELVVEDDAADGGALLAEPFGSLQVRTIDLGVVRQLARLANARVKLLPRLPHVRLVAALA